jgi:hypothetical protein
MSEGKSQDSDRHVNPKDVPKTTNMPGIGVRLSASRLFLLDSLLRCGNSMAQTGTSLFRFILVLSFCVAILCRQASFGGPYLSLRWAFQKSLISKADRLNFRHTISLRCHSQTHGALERRTAGITIRIAQESL